MPRLTTPDGVDLFYKDWMPAGQGRPVVLIHGWPLNADSWEQVAVQLARAGHRVVSYDRRGFGRSEQPWSGYDYDTMTDDLASLIDHLGLTDAALVGFSMGGGEAVRYMSRHGGKGVAKVALIASVVPYLLKGPDNPDGAPGEMFDGIKAALEKDRPAFLAEFFKSFYGQGLLSGVSQGVLDWSSHNAYFASPKATLDCVDAFGRTDFRGDLPSVTVPTLIIHGTGDQTVPIDPSARAAHKGIPGSVLKEYPGAPHGLLATHQDEVIRDLLEFLA